MAVSVSVIGSGALALALGVRHGLDADHLAAIDSMTRFNMVKRRPFAPYCGALFSAGHGAAIVLAAVVLAYLASAWTLPAWLGPAGKSVSAAVLLLLGTSNLLSVVSRRAESQQVHLIGVRTSLFAFILRSSGPWQTMLVGVLFALSFDALGFAVLFATNAAIIGSASLAALLATIFAVGMVTTGTANGVWLAQLAGRSDRAGAAASRAMTFSIALVSLLVGAAVASSCVWSSFDQWLTQHALGVSLLGVLVVLCAYLFATRVGASETRMFGPAYSRRP